jgi:hypothetical protein
MSSVNGKFSRWFVGLWSDEFSTIGRFRGHVIGWPIFQTGGLAFGFLALAFVPRSEPLHDGWAVWPTGPLSFVLGALLAVVVVGLWFAKDWARWAYGILWLAVIAFAGLSNLPRIDELEWWRTSGSIVFLAGLALYAIDFAAGATKRNEFAKARALIADERRERKSSIRVEFTRDEAVVLLDWVWRTEAITPRSDEDPSHRRVLEEFENYLKRSISRTSS